MDCSSWLRNSINRLFLNITDSNVIGTKEASFAHALFAASIVYQLSEACTRGNYSFCTCNHLRSSGSNPDEMLGFQIDQNISNRKKKEEDKNAENFTLNTDPTRTRTEWRWNGCPPNIHFGIELTRIFLDSIERQQMSPYSVLNLHNNMVGRKTVRKSMAIRCQCHGISGSCSIRTCWNEMVSFRSLTYQLYRQYTEAKQITYPWLMQTILKRFEQTENDPDSTRELQRKRSQKFLQQWIDRFHIDLDQISMLEKNQPNPKRLFERIGRDDGHYVVKNDEDGSKNNDRKKTKRITRSDLIFLRSTKSWCDRSSRTIHKKIDRFECLVDNHQSPTNGTIKSLDPDRAESEASSDQNELIKVNDDGSSWPPTKHCDQICCGLGVRSKITLKTFDCDCSFRFCCSIVCHRSCRKRSLTYECLLNAIDDSDDNGHADGDEDGDRTTTTTKTIGSNRSSNSSQDK
ncbi:Protein Wnt-7a [Sarcoptes scabiei]|uniref:Protein Wnt n=1 Tax=Sarcoptes scabiei TaxID=52283 RepID=A0A834VCT7_SARSC|nr:Protein Wnt-7a [Sarcoptes scabiei]